MSGEPWPPAEIFLKDFLRDVGGTLRREMSGEPGGTFGDVGGTLGEPWAALFLRTSTGEAGGPFGDVGGTRGAW